MNDFVLLIDAISKLLWPVITLLFICIIYKPLKDLLKNANNRNIKIKVGDNEIEIGEYIKQQTALISEIQKDNLIQNDEAQAENNAKTVNNSETIKTPEMVKIYRAKNKQKEEKKITRNRILWVDDYPSNNAALSESLRAQGYNIDISLSTADGLQKLNKKTYDLVISDMGRIENGLNNSTAGIDLVKQIRFDNKEIPIIIFASANGLQRINNEEKELSVLATTSGAELIRMVYENTIT